MAGESLGYEYMVCVGFVTGDAPAIPFDVCALPMTE